MGGILIVLVVLTLGKYALAGLTARPVDYTGVIRPQWGQPLWTTLVRAGQRQRVVMRKPESIRPKPTPRFQRPSAGIGYWFAPEM